VPRSCSTARPAEASRPAPGTTASQGVRPLRAASGTATAASTSASMRPAGGTSMPPGITSTSVARSRRRVASATPTPAAVSSRTTAPRARDRVPPRQTARRSLQRRGTAASATAGSASARSGTQHCATPTTTPPSAISGAGTSTRGTATATSTEFANAVQKLNCEAVTTSRKFSSRTSVGNQVGRSPTARAISWLVDEPYIAAAYSGKTDTTKTTSRNRYDAHPGRRPAVSCCRTGRPRAARFCAYRTAPLPAVFPMYPVLIGSLLPGRRRRGPARRVVVRPCRVRRPRPPRAGSTRPRRPGPAPRRPGAARA